MERGPGTFGQALRASRLRARLTQRELADRAGVSLRTVRSIELGYVERPHRESVERLAKVLDLPVPPDGDTATQAGVRIGLLGSLVVTADGEPVGLGASKQRTLFTLLAVQPNKVISREEIIDTLWGEHPPASCLNLVHTYISGLRKVFGPVSPISSAPGGYLLTADAAELDVVRFGELVAEAQDVEAGDAQRAAELYARALDQWRDPGFAELPATLSGHPAVTALSARRVATALSYADLELPRGRAERVVGRVRPVAHQEPLHEALHARLMLALAGCGQQAAALGLFTELRRRLADELGVEPGPEIRAAHASIVRDELPAQAPRAGYTQPAPAELPADVAGFVGREGHIDLLDGFLPETGDAVVVSTIVGTPGVGKTALAVHWAHRVRAKFPDGQLYVNLHGYASGSPVRPVEALRRLLRALGVPGDRIPVDVDEAAALYRTELADRRALVVLDNAATVTQVRPLLPGTPGSLVLITSRDRLTGLAATEGARRLDLEVLAPADARALLVRMLGEERALAEPEALDALGLTCAYLPLALRVAGANLASGPYTTIAEYLDELRERGTLTELAVDGDPLGAVRTAFDVSYERLDAPARRIFRLLGLVPGADFTPHAAAALAESSLVDARRSLARLAAASLVTEHVAGRFQFHDLLREYAAERAGLEGGTASVRAATERLFDFYLWTAAAADQLLYPYVERMTGPAGGAAALSGEAEAVGWLDAERANLFAAVVQAHARGLGHYAWPLVDAVRGYLWARGHSSAGLTAARIGLQAAQEEQNRAAEGAMYTVLGLIHYNLSDYRQSTVCHLRALAISRETGNRVAEASALHNLGRVHAQTGPHIEEARYYEQALEISRAEGYQHGEASALNYVGVAALSLGQLDKAAAHAVRALALSRGMGDRDLEARSLHNLGLAHWARGDLDQAIFLHRECLELTRRIQARHGVAPSLISLAETHSDAGRYLEAEDYAQAGVAEGRELGERRHEVGGLDILAAVSQARGDHAAAAQGYLVALEMAREIGFLYGEINVLIGLSVAHRSLGAFAEALDDVRRASAILAKSGSHILEARLWAESTHAQLDAGNPRPARESGDRAVGIAADRGQRLVEAQARHARGRVRASQGDREGARADWQAALREFTVVGVPAAAEIRNLLRGLEKRY